MEVLIEDFRQRGLTRIVRPVDYDPFFCCYVVTNLFTRNRGRRFARTCDGRFDLSLTQIWVDIKVAQRKLASRWWAPRMPEACANATQVGQKFPCNVKF